MLPKTHHYIPKFYLKKFSTSIPGRRLRHVWRFERGSDNPKLLAPSVAAVEQHYYSIPTASGEQNPVMEQLFLSRIDGDAAGVLSDIEAVDKEFRGLDREILAFFLAVMFLRVPARREEMEELVANLDKFQMECLAQTPGALERGLREIEEKKGEKSQVSADQLRKFLLGDPIVKASPVVSLGPIFLLSPALMDIFYKMRWKILKADDRFIFFTSDNPVTYTDPSARGAFSAGLNSANIQVTFPLSSRRCLFATHDVELQRRLVNTATPKEVRQILAEHLSPTVYKRATEEQIAKINQRTVEQAKRFAFSQELNEAVTNFMKRRFCKQSQLRTTLKIIKDSRTGIFLAGRGR